MLRNGKKIQSSGQRKIFVTKDKRQAIILTTLYLNYLQVLIAKAVWNFLFWIVIFKLLILKMRKETGLMTPRRFNIFRETHSLRTN